MFRIKALADLVSGEDLFLIYGMFCVLSPGRRVEQAPLDLYKGTDPLCKGRALVTFHFPEVPPHNTFPLWGKVSRVWRGVTNIQTIAVL